jgi:hypothetical protein
VKGIPTCYIFACPGNYTHSSTPYHGLVPYGVTREPGLILVSISGEVRFWDSIGIGLAGGDHYSTAYLDLGSREIVTNLIRADVSASSFFTTRLLQGPVVSDIHSLNVHRPPFPSYSHIHWW